MEEIVFWKEVPESEVPDDNDKDYWFVEDKYGKGVFLKRVVIPILSDQEIMDMADKEFPSFKAGYKAMQEELLKDMRERLMANEK